MRAAQDALTLLRRGMEGRTTGSTRANAHSSRSHAVFMLRVEATWRDADELGGGAKSCTSRMYLVDLAGESGGHLRIVACLWAVSLRDTSHDALCAVPTSASVWSGLFARKRRCAR